MKFFQELTKLCSFNKCFLLQNGACEWIFNPLTIQGRQVKVGQPGLVMWDLAPLCTVQVYNHTHVKNYDLVRTSVPCDVWTHTGMKKVNYHNTADLTNFAVHKPNPLTTAGSCVTRFRIPLTTQMCLGTEKYNHSINGCTVFGVVSEVHKEQEMLPLV